MVAVGSYSVRPVLLNTKEMIALTVDKLLETFKLRLIAKFGKVMLVYSWHLDLQTQQSLMILKVSYSHAQSHDTHTHAYIMIIYCTPYR